MKTLVFIITLTAGAFSLCFLGYGMWMYNKRKKQTPQREMSKKELYINIIGWSFLIIELLGLALLCKIAFFLKIY